PRRPVPAQDVRVPGCWVVAREGRCGRVRHPRAWPRCLRASRPRQKKKVVRCAWSAALGPMRQGVNLAFSVRDRRGDAMPTMPIGPVPTLSTVLCNHGLSATRSAHRAIFALLAFALLAAAPGPAKAVGADGQLTWGVHISLAPTWFDPAEMSGI